MAGECIPVELTERQARLVGDLAESFGLQADGMR